jgi:multidrug transporter EmrE-like cation transporter
MSAGTLALILVSVTLSAVAQLAFKLGLSGGAAGRKLLPAEGWAGPVAGFATPGVLVGLALYGIGTLLWLSALSRAEVSQAYPFVALGFVLTAVFGRLLFDDALGGQRVLGIALVIAGVALIARS